MDGNPPRRGIDGEGKQGKAREGPRVTCDGDFPRVQHWGPADQPGRPCDHLKGPLPKRDWLWECAGDGVLPCNPARGLGDILPQAC